MGMEKENLGEREQGERDRQLCQLLAGSHRDKLDDEM